VLTTLLPQRSLPPTVPTNPKPGGVRTTVYQFSRAIYRELSPLVAEHGGCPDSRQKILDACEDTMQRLLHDRRYFAKPTKTLFDEIRVCFPLHDQVRVYQVVDRHVKLAGRYLDTTPPEELMIEGRRECRAHTRRGTPCQREPLPGREYCPSHKHLEEHADVGIQDPRIPALA
jgi:hypothetical protein